MSTKIYNAYRLGQTIGTGELFEFVNGDFRQQLDKTRDLLDSQKVLGDTVKLLDRTFFGLHDLLEKEDNSQRDKESDCTPVEIVVKEIIEEQKNERIGTVFHDPHSFSASIGYDDHREEVMFLCHHQKSEYNECLEKLGLIDWHYQNSTDKPDEVSEEEWKERKESWDRVMPSGLPLKTMLEFSLRSNRFWGIDLNNILNQINSLSDQNDSTFSLDVLNKAWADVSGEQARSKDLADYFLTKSVLEAKGFDWYLKHSRISTIIRLSRELAVHLVPMMPQYTLEEINSMQSWDARILSEDKATLQATIDDFVNRFVDEVEN